jgi:murein DD-endopeptidase MepM/ murein hydrolase activator NlpD
MLPIVALAGLVACTEPTPTEETDLPADSDVDTDIEVLRGRVAFGFPLPERAKVLIPPTGFDHDPTVQDDDALGRAQCKDYDGRGFPYCYDGHDGNDYSLLGAFDAMDAGSMPIVAALAGTVVETEDGNYDRCHTDLSIGDVTCDGHPMRGNYVKLDHGAGIQTWYWHMKSGSVAVTVGQTVQCGDTLGLVGSSGYSSTPHLHFEARVDGAPLDPYAGALSQPETWWEDQVTEDGLPGAGCAAR